MKTAYFNLRFIDIVFLAVFALALASGTQMLRIDSDLGRHLVIGNIILNDHTIPTHDLLSHTRFGLSRPPYEWLSQVLFAFAYRLLGLDGVIFLTALIIAMTFTLLYQISYRRSGSPIVALIIVFIGVGAASLHWLPRPHIFTLLYLVVWTELLDKLTRSKPPKYYIYPVVMLLWANLHGGFIFGILVWAAYFAGLIWSGLQKRSNAQTAKRLLSVGAISIIATIITPDLWRNWEAVLNNRSTFILNRTIETMRPNLADESIIPFTLLLILTIFLLAENRIRVKANHVFLLLGFGFLSLLIARNIPLFVVTSIPILSELSAYSLSRFSAWKKIDKRFTEFGSTSRRSILAITVTLIASIYFAYQSLISDHQIYQFDSKIFPVDAVNWLDANPQEGNMFNFFTWGGYLLYRLWPEQQVFIDGQTDFYGEALSREYIQVESLQDGWENIFLKYNIDWVITQSGQPLEEALLKDSWDILYQDNTAIILRTP